MILTFDKNDIPFGMDHQFYRGIPEGIKFEVLDFLSDNKIKLKGPGYGGDPYGNGSIYVCVVHLPEGFRQKVLKELYGIIDEFECVFHPMKSCAREHCPARVHASDKSLPTIGGVPISNCPFISLQKVSQPKQTLKDRITHILITDTSIVLTPDQAIHLCDISEKIIKLCGADPLKVVEGL
jgi:hypothetical protein